MVYDPLSGSVKWKGDVLFPTGSAVVKDSAKGGLTEFAKIVNSAAARDFEVIVVGHTDSASIYYEETKAKHPTNWHLSSHRAIGVADVLLQAGCEGARVGVMGCSEFRPVASNENPEGMSRNRRVEIYLVPRGSVVSAT